MTNIQKAARAIADTKCPHATIGGWPCSACLIAAIERTFGPLFTALENYLRSHKDPVNYPYPSVGKRLDAVIEEFAQLARDAQPDKVKQP